MQDGPHRDLMLAAIAAEADGHRALLRGDLAEARAAYGQAADGYGASWAVAPPRSYGRLVGRMKAAVLAGADRDAADEVLAALRDDPDAAGSPVAQYARAIASLVVGDDDAALAAAEVMRGGSEAAQRAAAALAAIASRDTHAYAHALEAIETDFAARAEHLTGVPIADTAVMLEALAAHRNLAVGPGGALRPAPPA
jgi:hypothetical protein